MSVILNGPATVRHASRTLALLRPVRMIRRALRLSPSPVN